MATIVLSAPSLDTTDHWLTPWSASSRPWTELYGLRIRPKARPVVELAPIQRLVPDDLMLKIFAYLPPYQLGRLSYVCFSWRDYVKDSTLWERHCREAFQADPPGVLEQHYKLYKYSWRELFLRRPHLRFDGLYVSRNTYIHTGVTEWRIKNPVHLVSYFRYIRFFPDGNLLTRTSPEVVSKVERTLRRIPEVIKPEDTVHVGRWHLQDNQLRTKMRLPNTSGTEIWTQLTLRSKFAPGTNNRLDVVRIYSHEGGFSADIGGGFVHEEELLQEGALTHRRGTNSYVFIPEDELQTHIFNNPELDYFIAG